MEDIILLPLVSQNCQTLEYSSDRWLARKRELRDAGYELASEQEGLDFPKKLIPPELNGKPILFVDDYKAGDNRAILVYVNGGFCHLKIVQLDDLSDPRIMIACRRKPAP